MLRGLRANALYILTHPEYEEILQAPYEALLAAMPRDVPLTERRLAMARSFCQTSSYARERDRKRWAREGAHRSA